MQKISDQTRYSREPITVAELIGLHSRRQIYGW